MSGHVVYQAQLREQTGKITRREADKTLTEMQRVARLNATGGKYSTGRLAASIYKSGPLIVGYTAHGSVGSRLDYAKVVEGGARIHEIFPKGAPHIYRFGAPRRPMLRFVWRGRIRYFHQIPGGPNTIGRSHPGMKGKHFLVRAMLRVAARGRLRVVVFET